MHIQIKDINPYQFSIKLTLNKKYLIEKYSIIIIFLVLPYHLKILFYNFLIYLYPKH